MNITSWEKFGFKFGAFLCKCGTLHEFIPIEKLDGRKCNFCGKINKEKLWDNLK